ncbi:MAG: protein-disulfide isomerase [Proteobacteria bacterium]|nr:protein-disulfide isomerase [Pseudomonadota bacterium]
MTILHYIYDPLCGWCYGAAPLLRLAREVLAVCPHGGGMMTGARRQTVTPQLREFVKQHDERIAQLTGQYFGPGYVDGLLRDGSAVLDSEPPTAAMLAAEAIAGRGLDMLAQLQVAHYVEGRQIADRSTLIAVATALGLDPAAFAEALDRQSGDAVQRHIKETRQLMAEVGVLGFPGFVLETDGVLQVIDIARYLGHPKAFQDWLRR